MHASIRDVVEELGKLSSSIAPNVVELVYEPLGGLLGDGRGRDWWSLVRKEIAIVGGCKLKLEVYCRAPLAMRAEDLVVSRTVQGLALGQIRVSVLREQASLVSAVKVILMSVYSSAGRTERGSSQRVP